MSRGTECVSVDMDFKLDQNLVGLDVVTNSSILQLWYPRLFASQQSLVIFFKRKIVKSGLFVKRVDMFLI